MLMAPEKVAVFPVIFPEKFTVVVDRADANTRVPLPDKYAAIVVPPYHLNPVDVDADENHKLLDSIPMA